MKRPNPIVAWASRPCRTFLRKLTRHGRDARATLLIAGVLGLFSSAAFADPVLAFPGAEGFGALATGGRGGEIVHVTNLNDSGPGSFRDAVSRPNRFVVFDVGGIIQLKSPVKGMSNITIAGQTAPGEGITIIGGGLSFSGEKNVIVRYLRMRGGIDTSRGSKVLNVAGEGSNMIFDHLSIAWGRWDDLGFTQKSHDITLQHCLIGESIDPQRFGALIDGANNISVIGNLWINHSSRNPKGKANMQYINNVIYNWGGTGYAGGHSGAEWRQDLINNYFIKGPSSNNTYAGGFDKTDILFLSGNAVDLNCDGKLNGRPIDESELKPMTDKAEQPTIAKEAYNKPAVKVKVLSPEEAYARIVKSVGASIHRDQTDRRLISQLTSLGTDGKIIKSEEEVKGIGELKESKSRPDTDADGIPDAWETAHQMNPNYPKDASNLDGSGYSMIEVYVNELAGE